MSTLPEVCALAPEGDPCGLHRVPELGSGDPRVRVAVLDGPVDLDHPAFRGARLEQVGGTPGEAGPAGAHGTHVASLLFGQPESGLTGLIPRCTGRVEPVFGNSGDGGPVRASQTELARAIHRALDWGASVINISAGELGEAPQAEPHLSSAVEAAREAGALVVAAAGNQGCACLNLPASLPGVLAVGSLDREGWPSAFSNWGLDYARHGILAPGENLLGAAAGGARRLSGTSQAAAVISGVAALLLSHQLRRGRIADARAIRQALLQSAAGCLDPTIPGCDRFLAGRLDLPGALEWLQTGDSMSIHEPESAAVEPSSVAPESSLPEPSPTETPVETAVPEVSSTAIPETAPPALTLSCAEPADAGDCGCSCGGTGGAEAAGALVYALGSLGTDLGNEARRDSFRQRGLENPDDPAQVLAYLDQHPEAAEAVTWVLTQETTPLYAISPRGAFAAEAFGTLRELLGHQVRSEAEIVSVPGLLGGSTTLLDGQTVPVLEPELRGLASWSTPKLVEAVLAKGSGGTAGEKAGGAAAKEARKGAIANFLERIYYELRNLGRAPRERALNYAATDAFQVDEVFQEALAADLALNTIDVARSPLCRPHSDCWDVRMTFFDPRQRLERAQRVFRFTVDVSDVVPVTVGKVRQWDAY